MGLPGFDVFIEAVLRNHRDESCCIKRDSKTTQATFTGATSDEIWEAFDAVEAPSDLVLV